MIIDEKLGGATRRHPDGAPAPGVAIASGLRLYSKKMVNPLKSLSIRGKLLLAFSIISLISTVAFSSYTYFLQRATILDGIDEKLKVAARSVQPLLPDGFHDRITDKTRSPPRSTWPTCTC